MIERTTPERLAQYSDAGARHLMLRIGSFDPMRQLPAVAELAVRLRNGGHRTASILQRSRP